MVCPKSPMWESEGEAWSEDESVSSSGSREGNVCGDALHVIELYGPGGQISLVLQDWGAGRKWSCHMVLDMLCQELNGTCKRPFVMARKAFLLPWTGCDKKRKGMW